MFLASSGPDLNKPSSGLETLCVLESVERDAVCVFTSVWTMDRRCDRISDTMPRMSANSCSLMCCIRRSRAMNVPVRPTPALNHRHRQTVIKPLLLLSDRHGPGVTTPTNGSQKHHNGHDIIGIIAFLWLLAVRM